MKASYFISKYSNLPKDVIYELLDYFAASSEGYSDNSIATIHSNKASLAIAYANLVIEDPENITRSHITMLKKEFSSEQIHALNKLIAELVLLDSD